MIYVLISTVLNTPWSTSYFLSSPAKNQIIPSIDWAIYGKSNFMSRILVWWTAENLESYSLQTANGLAKFELHNNLLSDQCYILGVKSMLICKHLSMQHYWTDSIMSPRCPASGWHSKSQITDTSSLLLYTYHQCRGKQLNSGNFWRQFRNVICMDIKVWGLWVGEHLRPSAKAQYEMISLSSGT